MKKIKFWRTEIQQLSVPERMIFNTAIKKLLSWQVFKDEYLELDLIRRLLESEIQINSEEVQIIKPNVLEKNGHGTEHKIGIQYSSRKT